MTWIVFNMIFLFYCKVFILKFLWIYKDGKPKLKNEYIERKYLKYMQKNQFLKIKKSLLELEKDFIEWKDGQLKDREVKIKREIEILFFKPIIVLVMMIWINLNRKKCRK